MNTEGVLENRVDGKSQADIHSIVMFKGDFLGNLIDAVALVEVLEFIIKNHEEIDFNKPSMLGMSILVEQIKGLLNIKANLVASDC
jgi:hypothetical protein